MPLYLDTLGETDVAIAICARCSCKYPHAQLVQDPNYPGLRVCRDGCQDEFDPYRLPARSADQIALEWTRPDLNLAPGPMNVPVSPITAVLGDMGTTAISAQPGCRDIELSSAASVVQVPQPWGPNQFYSVGAVVTPGAEYGPAVSGTNPQKTFLCVMPGLSGPTAPQWDEATGAITNDNAVIWLTDGILLP